MKRSRSPQSEQDSPQILDELEAVDTARKIVGLDDPDTSPATAFEMRCTLPPHREPVAFHSYGDYEAHYGKEHVYRCTECHRNLPSAHYLGLHFEECHDPFAAIKRDKGEHTYSCFAEDCDRKCRTPQKRRMHAIDKHMFPKNYFFAVTKEGIDGRSSLLLGQSHHRRRSSTAKGTVTGTSPGKETGWQAKSSGREHIRDVHERPDSEMEDLAGAMSSLQFVPTSIRFGRAGNKPGFARR